jgi:hypothetical protein
LHREIDTHAADRRHRVCRIADAQQSGTCPLAQPVDRHRKQLDVVERAQLVRAFAEPGDEREQLLAELFDAVRCDRVILVFRDHERVAIETTVAHALLVRAGGVVAQAEPIGHAVAR